MVRVGVIRRFVPALERNRRQIPERRMPPPRIVKSLDVVEHRTLCLLVRSEAMPRQQFALQRRKEALGHRVVIAVADRTHRWFDIGLGTSVAERDRRVLRALIRVVDDSVRAAFCQRHVERIKHDLSVQRGGKRPADNTA